MTDIPIEDPGAKAPALRDALFGASFCQVPLTTNSVTPTAVDYKQKVAILTTDGSAGPQVVDLASPSLDDNGLNIPNTGRIVIITIGTQTDPADAVHITCDGSFNIKTIDPQIGESHTYGVTDSPGVVLDYPGATAVFVWQTDHFAWSPAASDFNAWANMQTGHDITIQGFQVQGGNGQGAYLEGGPSGTANGGAAGVSGGGGQVDGGACQVSGGSGNTGVGGELRMTGGGGNDVIGSKTGGDANLIGGFYGGAANVTGGQGAFGDGTTVGGPVNIKGGFSDVGGDTHIGGGDGGYTGGDLYLDAGANTAVGDPHTADGRIIIGSINPLPTADPHHVGQLYTLAGVLHVSAG